MPAKEANEQKPSSPRRFDILTYLPVPWVPYAELMRVHKPVGILNIYFPYLYGCLFAACIAKPQMPLSAVLKANLLVFPLGFVLRSAGCTWNDIIDRDLDRQVERCRSRPMARGAVTPVHGYMFFTVLALIWFALLIQAGVEATIYGLVALALAMIYPFTKRITDYAQVFLGFTLSWGILVGCQIQGVRPLALFSEGVPLAVALVCLFLSYMTWTVIHDTIYGFQDIKDDARAGVKSMTVRYQHSALLLLSVLGLLEVVLHGIMGVMIGAGATYYTITCFGTSVVLFLMMSKVDLKDTASCWWYFKTGSLAVGWAITIGLGGELMQRMMVA